MFTADFPAVTKWQHASKKKKSNSYRYKCIYIKHYFRVYKSCKLYLMGYLTLLKDAFFKRVSVLDKVTGHFITGAADPFSHFT